MAYHQSTETILTPLRSIIGLNNIMRTPITTLIPTPMMGHYAMTGEVDLVRGGLYENFISPLNIIVSDGIYIDKSWRYMYDSLDLENTLEQKIINILEVESIIKEIDVSQQLDIDRLRKEMRPLIDSLFCLRCYHYSTTNLSFKQKETILNNPELAREIIREHGHPEAYSYVYDCFIIYLLSGIVCTNIHNATGYFRFIYDLFSDDFGIDIPKCNGDVDTHNWVVNLYNHSIKESSIFLTKYNNPARIKKPLEHFGVQYETSRNDRRGIANESNTLNQLEKCLKLRDTNLAKSLRQEYSRILDYSKSDKIEKSLPDIKGIDSIWKPLKIEYESHLSVSSKLNKLNDYLTIPSLILSPFSPEVSLAPIVPWMLSKINDVYTTRKIRKKCPWFFLRQNFEILNTMI